MSDLYTRFIAKLVFPLQERVKKHDTVRVRRQMEESQWWSAERIAALQVERLKAFLTDIGANASLALRPLPRPRPTTLPCCTS